MKKIVHVKTKDELIRQLQELDCPGNTPVCHPEKDEEWWVEPISDVYVSRAQIGDDDAGYYPGKPLESKCIIIF